MNTSVDKFRTRIHCPAPRNGVIDTGVAVYLGLLCERVLDSKPAEPFPGGGPRQDLATLSGGRIL